MKKLAKDLVVGDRIDFPATEYGKSHPMTYSGTIREVEHHHGLVMLKVIGPGGEYAVYYASDINVTMAPTPIADSYIMTPNKPSTKFRGRSIE
jgi:hypothetical protein